MAAGHLEPEVRKKSTMPNGYVFVPKGDVYITANVRRRTHAAGSTLYVVTSDDRKKQLGLRCPGVIHEAVLADSQATAAARAAVVRSRDEVAERTFEEAMLGLFPNIPKAEVPAILRRTLEKRSRRVGRTGRLEMEAKVRLAVLAHIRHGHTPYHGLLKDGMPRHAARRKIAGEINKVALQWGRESDAPLVRMRKEKKDHTEKEEARNADEKRAKKAARRTARRAARRAAGKAARKAAVQSIATRSLRLRSGKRVEVPEVDVDAEEEEEEEEDGDEYMDEDIDHEDDSFIVEEDLEDSDDDWTL